MSKHTMGSNVGGEHGGYSQNGDTSSAGGGMETPMAHTSKEASTKGQKAPMNSTGSNQ